MKDMTWWGRLEQAIVRDEKFYWTLSSYAAVFVIFLNEWTLHSPAVGIVVSSIFFLINSIFVGSSFFEKEEPFLRFAFGGLLLVTIIGIVGWTVLITYNLDPLRSTIVLCVVAAISSVANKATHFTFSIEFARNSSSE